MSKPLSETVFLREHQESEGIELELPERDALSALVPGATITPMRGTGSFYRINPRNNVGAVQIGARRFVLQPKIAISRLMFLVSYSIDSAAWLGSDFDFEEDEDVFEAIVPGFAFQLEAALRQGLLQGYNVEEGSLQTVRGRIRFNDQIRDRLGLMPPIECRFDEFTTDNVANRILKAAITSLLSLPLRHPRTRSRLRRLAAAFGGVTSVSYSPRSVPTVQFDRLTAHFRRPVELARLILRSRSFDARGGKIPASAFVLDLSSVFEDFVFAALRESLGLSYSQFPQQCAGKRLYLDAGEKLRLEPDLSWWVDGRCVFVGDAKYKRTPTTAGLRHPDAYQILAYATATRLKQGLLVYAAGEERQSYLIPAANRRIQVETLDLDVEPRQLLDQVDALANVVRAQAFGPFAYEGLDEHRRTLEPA